MHQQTLGSGARYKAHYSIEQNIAVFSNQDEYENT